MIQTVFLALAYVCLEMHKHKRTWYAEFLLSCMTKCLRCGGAILLILLQECFKFYKTIERLSFLWSLEHTPSCVM